MSTNKNIRLPHECKPNTARQIAKREAKELKARMAEFLDTIKNVTDLELFDIFCQVDQSDDWDGGFTLEQSWKAEHAAAEMRERLQGHQNDRDRDNLQTSEGTLT
jgi:hypothetical protein